MHEEGRPVQVGAAPADVTVSELDGGVVASGAGRSGGSSLDFPDYRPQGTYPKAAVVARALGAVDVLNPGDSDFSYGADFQVDAESEGRSDDNGNNIIQRGLSSDPVMFKAELDANRRPRCTVKGSTGTVTVLAFISVEPGRWYRVKCEREADDLSIYVSEYLPSGDATTALREDDGRIGTVAFDRDVPVSVGSKVARDGTVIRSASDQFNGLVDWAFVAVG
jgi:hypothetical protein